MAESKSTPAQAGNIRATTPHLIVQTLEQNGTAACDLEGAAELGALVAERDQALADMKAAGSGHAAFSVASKREAQLAAQIRSMRASSEREEEPAIYTHGLSPLELLGHLRVELGKVQNDVVRADSLISVAGLALRNMDCDHDGDVADVLQNHAWPELKGAQDALETAEQILNRLDQLSENAALGAALREVFHG